MKRWFLPLPAVLAMTVGTVIAACSSNGTQTSVLPSSEQIEPQTLSANANAAGRVRYKLIDLGTFGGPSSHFINGFDGILNNQGSAVGWADTAESDPNPAFCFNPDCFVSHAFQWSDGTSRDLGTLPGGSSSQAVWISSNGFIAGNAENGQFDPLMPPGFPQGRAVLWKDGHIIDLGTLGGGYESGTGTVNSRGQVIGVSLNRTPDQFSLAGPGFFPTQTRAFLWQEGVMRDLGTLGGADAAASEVNESGEIVGASYTNSTPNAGTGLPTLDPFFWKNGKMIDLGTLGGTFGAGNLLNDRGQVIGVSNLAGDVVTHPFLWDRGKLTDLGTLGGNNGETNWIDNDGDIVGKADLPGASPQNHDAVLWRRGSKIDLGKLPGDTCSNAYYVNSHGQVVGTSEDRALCLIPAGEHAFLWQNGGPMMDLNSLIPAGAGLHLTSAFAINDRGQIAGIGTPPGCSHPALCGHAYVLVPCNASVDASNCREEELGSPAVRTLRPALPHQRFNPWNASPWFRCHRASCARMSG